MTSPNAADLIIFRAMWDDLHAKSNADTYWLTDWLDRLPREYLDNARDILRICPPDFDNFHAWGVRYHDCISFAVGKRPQKRLEQEHNRAIALLPWSKSKGGRTGKCGACVKTKIR